MANKIVYELGLNNQNFMQGISQADNSVNHLENSLTHVAGAMGLAFSVETLVDWGKEIFNVTAEMQGFDNIIKYSSKNTDDANKNFDYLTDAIHRLHLPLVEATKSFAEVEAGMYGTGIEGQKLRNMFEGISEASTALHLSSEQFSHVTFALKEIGELGTLQSRQMRMLAFALPGAMNLAAESMHMGTAKFHEAMEKGEIQSSAFLQNFSAKLKEHFQGALENAGHSLQAMKNDTESAFDGLRIHIGTTLESAFASLLKNLQGVAVAMGNAFDWIIRNKDSFAVLGSVLLSLVKTYAVYKGLMIAGLAVQKLAVLWNKIEYASIMLLGDGFMKAGVASKFFAGTFEYLMSAIEANPIGAVIIGIGALAAAFSGLSTSIHQATAEHESFRESIEKDVKGGIQNATQDIINIAQRYETGIKSFDKSGKAVGYSIEEQNKLIEKGIQDQIKLYEEAHTVMINGSPVLNYSYGDQQYMKTMKNYHDVLKHRGNALGDVVTNNQNGDIINKGSKATPAKSVNIKIDIRELVHEFNIKTTNISQAVGKVKDMVVQTLTSAVNDSQIIAGD